MLLDIIIPASIVSGMGLVFGLGLAYASKKFEVKVDDRIAQVREVLPGANCGACGQTGCDGFAEGVVEGRCKVNGCPVGGNEVAKKIGEILGVKADKVEPRVARVMCAGTYDKCRTKFSYSGIDDCAAAASLFGGPSSCSYGCVGMGTCVKACAFGAISIENGVAIVDESKCTACTKCVAACPKHIIEIVPLHSQYTVRCRSYDKGAVTRKNCDVGCIGCTKCVKACPRNAIAMDGALAKINPELCDNCGECIKVCPSGSINRYICVIESDASA